MLVNSEKTQCPAERCGRATPSQAGSFMLPGVCNDHEPAPEGKI